MHKINAKKLLSDFFLPPANKYKMEFAVINIFILILIVYSFFKVDFDSSTMLTLSQLTLNFVFVIAAVGFTAFSLNVNKNTRIVHFKSNKRDLIRNYIGIIFTSSSVAVLTFIVSLLNISQMVNKIYAIVSLLLIQHIIMSTFKTISEYLNI